MNYVGRLLVFVLIGIVFLGCNKDEKTTGSISGIVVDDISLDPVSGAEVEIERLSKTALSTMDGSFLLSDIPAGSYNVVVNKDGFVESRKTVSVASGQTAETTFEIKKVIPVFNPDSLTLSAGQPSTILGITNPGDGKMTLNITASQSWLKVDQPIISLESSETKNITVSYDPEMLESGEFIEELSVTTDGQSTNIPVAVYNDEIPDIVWQNWYLSVPIDNGDGKATSIFYEDIVNDDLTEEEKEYFYYDEMTEAYVMWTKFTGYTTSGYQPLNGDSYCRTELREFWRGVQDTNDNWYFNPGETHIMESTLNVDSVEGSRGRTFIAQIHGKKSTIPGIDNGPATVKVLWEYGQIEVEYYVAPSNPDGEWTSSTNAKSEKIRVDNEKFTIKLKVDDGVLYWALECEAKGVNQDYVELYDYASNGYHYDNYFKTGNYFQWKQDYEKVAQVKLYKVITQHN